MIKRYRGTLQGDGPLAGCEVEMVTTETPIPNLPEASPIEKLNNALRNRRLLDESKIFYAGPQGQGVYQPTGPVVDSTLAGKDEEMQ
jgi:hypothetical protein